MSQTSIDVNQSTVIQLNKGSVKDDYRFLKKLGSGGFADVFVCEHRLTKQKRCVKAILYDQESELAELMQEIELLKEIDHPHVVQIFEYYITKSHVYIVSEFLQGGELFDKIATMNHFDEANIARIMDQLLSAVAYMHKHSVIHRDIKPENIVFETADEHSNIKVIDFGTCKRITENEKLRVKLGTCYYVAPEVLLKHYDKKCDVWSCGVILYVLLCGYPPFNAKHDKEIFAKILKGEFRFPEEEWSTISLEAKDLVTKMLMFDQRKRPDAAELLMHPWFEKCLGKGLAAPLNAKILNNLRSFHSESTFQKAMKLYMASFFDLKNEKSKLLEAFKALDKDHDGQLTREELMEAYEKHGSASNAEEIVSQILENLDFNKTHAIDFTEFLIANIDYKKKVNSDSLHQIFQIMDKNSDGFLSSAEISQFLANGLEDSEGVGKKVLEEIDNNHDGKVSYNEFVTAITKSL